ncbi:hypothetical protein DFH27DRAFT_656498 [Peziza echinospora]|nr:hypothetical protein DFH27DRAFT_656498 [Peziza echinospora]
MQLFPIPKAQIPIESDQMADKIALPVLPQTCSPLVDLPSEILHRCLYFLYSDRNYYSRQLNEEEYFSGRQVFVYPWINLLLTCRRLHAIVLPLSLSHLAFSTPGPLLRFIPRELRPDFSLASEDRIADPRWVKELTILPDFKGGEGMADTWKALVAVLPEMENVHTLMWTSRWEDASVVALLAGMKNLKRISLRLGGMVWADAQLKGLNEIVAWSWQVKSPDRGADYEQWVEGPEGNILQRSAETLETLHILLSTRILLDPVAKRGWFDFEKTLVPLPKLRVLRLAGVPHRTRTCIERVIDGSVLQELQNVQRGAFAPASMITLTNLEKLAGRGPLQELLNILRCNRRSLSDLRIVICGGNPPRPPGFCPYPDGDPIVPCGGYVVTQTAIEAIAGNGNLKTLMLLTEDVRHKIPGILREDTVEKLVKSCPLLEVLAIDVFLGSYIDLPGILAQAQHLKHLSIAIILNPIIIWPSPEELDETDSQITNQLSSLRTRIMHQLSSTENDWALPKADEEITPREETCVEGISNEARPMTLQEAILWQFISVGLARRLQTLEVYMVNRLAEAPNFLKKTFTRYEFRKRRQDEVMEREYKEELGEFKAPPGYQYSWNKGSAVVANDKDFKGARSEVFVLANSSEMSWRRESLEGGLQIW